MQENITKEIAIQESIPAYRVLRSTYSLLGLTLAFSLFVVDYVLKNDLPQLPWWGMLIGFYGLLFLVHYTSRSAWGILSAFALTGFLGYSIGGLVQFYLSENMGDIVLLALLSTTVVFFALSFFVFITKKDMSFLSGMMFSLFIVLLIGVIGNAILASSIFSLVLSGLFTIFASAGILMTTSNIINGGQTNYIIATIEIYVSLYNLFVSFLNIFSYFKDE